MAVNLFPLNSYCHGLMPLTLRLAPVTADSHWSLTPLTLRLAPVTADSHWALTSLTLRLAPVTAGSHRSALLFYHHSSAIFNYLKGTSQLTQGVLLYSKVSSQEEPGPLRHP